ncbi:MAG: SufD family Fe-S cluster assembly protein [Candidatus Kerfeldbacteria bacterium]
MGTVAPLDPEQLFYLRSRGISNKVAEDIVTKAILKSVNA